MLLNMSLNRIYLNDGWRFNDGINQVRVPHTCKETPYNYFSEKIYQFQSEYRRELEIKSDWIDRILLLTFEGVAHKAEVYINDKFVGKHECGYTSFTLDITSFVDFEEKNYLTVKVDSREDLNIPPFGKVIDYLTYGGIYRDVYLDIKGQEYIEDVFVITKDCVKEEKILDLEVTLNKGSDDLSVEIILMDENNNLIKEFNYGSVPAKISGVENWDTHTPWLYNLKVLLFKNEKIVDIKDVRFGFREFEFKSDGFYLNGDKVKIRGINRHQSYPYVGYAMPERAQRTDADIIKYELGLNAVRTSHYPQSKYFINRCDELGILVFTEIPGWQHIGDEEWKRVAIENTREMVMQYRNHASVFIWGVRINESQDDDEFYEKANKIAHELDPTRATGGVRFLKKSSLLEDVYTYNDFLHNGLTKGAEDKKDVTPDMNKAYMVTEYNGHMYPTKSFDDEAHRLEHALRHARVLNSINEQDDIAGSFGWCMFDYNTHKDFGSGDKICYHGVMDMFRNPKPASYVYSSQQEEKNVSYVSSSMDIGEHPGGYIGEVYVFTNADSVRLYKNDDFVKEFFPTDKFNFLKHPPILIDDFVGELMKKHEKYNHKTCEDLKEVLNAVAKYGQSGLPLKYKIKMAKVMLTSGIKMSDGIELFGKYIGNWGGEITSYRFEAVKDGVKFKSILKEPMDKLRLQVKADTLLLQEKHTYDVASLRFTVEDENENIAHYFQEPLVLSAQGDIEIIGPNTITLRGGCAGTYIKSVGKAGEGVLKITNPVLGEDRIIFTIKK